MRQIDKIMVFDSFGLPKVMFDFNNHQLIVDEVLLSGFLSAIDGLSDSIFKGQSTYFLIDNGTQKISLFKNQNLVLAAISSENLVEFKDQMLSLLDYFDQKYDMDDGEMFDQEFYEEFRIKLIRILFFLPIVQDWVPVPKLEEEKWNLHRQIFPILQKIDGTKEIQDLEGYSYDSREDIFEVLNYAFHEGILQFTNTIEPRDYVVGTEKLQHLLMGKSDEYKIIKNQFVDFNLLEIFKAVQHYSRIMDLQEIFREKVVAVIEELHNLGYFALVGENIRKLLNTVDLIEDLVKIIQKVGKRGKIIPELKFVIEDFDEPAILSRFTFEKKQITFNKENLFDLSNQFKSTEKSVQLWLQFGKILLDKFYPRYQKKLNEEISDLVQSKYMICLHREEMAILDPFLAILESSCFDD